MTKLPHWIQAVDGVNLGIFKYAFDEALKNNLSYDERRTIIHVHASYIIGINALSEFNTRDYAWEWGGRVIEGGDLLDFSHLAEWINPDLY